MQHSGCQRQPASSLGPAIIAGLFLYLAWWLYGLDQAGNEYAGWGALAAGLASGRQLLNAMSAYSLNSRARAAERAARAVQKTHGSARWGTIKDLRRAGMLGKGAFFLGALKGRDVFYTGEGSAFIFAPPGTGKTVASVIPQLIQDHFDQEGRVISKFVLDITGELYCVTHRHLEREGYRVIALCAWSEKMSRELGVEIHDAGCNFLLQLLDAGAETKDLAEKFAKLLLPASANDNSTAEYFHGFACEILTWCMLILAEKCNPSIMNLVEVRRLLMSSPKEFDDMLAVTSQSEAFNGTLRELANKLMETRINAGEEWSGAINTATSRLKLYDAFGPVGHHVSTTNGFDFATIKDQKTVVFLIVPPEFIESHQPFVNFMLSAATERMVQDRTNRGVLCIYDECANAGYLPVLLKSIALHRKFGLRYAIYTQSMSQMRRLYGEDGLRDMLSLCGVLQAFGTREPETLKMLSELAGQDTHKEFSQSLQPNMDDPYARSGYTKSASNQGHALIRPEDIRTMPEDKQLVFIENHPPLILDKVSYLKRRAWRRCTDPNPYYRK